MATRAIKRELAELQSDGALRGKALDRRWALERELDKRRREVPDTDKLADAMARLDSIAARCDALEGRADAPERTVSKDVLNQKLRDGTWQMEYEPDSFGRFTIRKPNGSSETMRLKSPSGGFNRP